MPSVKFSSIINLPLLISKIIRDLSNISERLEIKSVERISFSCTGPFASCKISRSESDGITEFVKK